MKIKNLSKKVKEEINSLTRKEIVKNYAYTHELRWYGLDAVAHFHLMDKARDVYGGKISKDDFVEKYRLRFDKYGRIAVPFESIEKDGVFIPEMAYWGKKGRSEVDVSLFKGDHKNRIFMDSWKNKDSAKGLINRKWEFSDFGTSYLVEQGVIYGKDMWRSCVEEFEETKNGVIYDGCVCEPPMDPKIKRLGENLIGYYSGLIGD